MECLLYLWKKTHTKFLWKNAHTPYKLTWVLYIMYSYSEHKYKTYCFIIPTDCMTNYRSDQIINQSVRQMVKWLFKCLPYCFFFFNTAKTFSCPFVSQYNKLAKLNWNKYFVCVLGAVCCWSEVSWAVLWIVEGYGRVMKWQCWHSCFVLQTVRLSLFFICNKNFKTLKLKANNSYNFKFSLILSFKK